MLHAVQLTAPARQGIVNRGYVGMGLVEHSSYVVEILARRSDSVSLTVGFIMRQENTDDISGRGGRWRSRSEDIAMSSFCKAVPLERSTLMVEEWVWLGCNITASQTGAAELAVTLDSAGTIVLDYVSVMPAKNVDAGHPFRFDMLQLLADLKPGVLRYPGGCFIEGLSLAEGPYIWKETIGHLAERPGHMDWMWGYWSTDGLGFYEWLQLAELLQTESVWVVNAGLSLVDEAPDVGQFELWILEALDSIEFAIGAADSTQWGRVRAELGHPAPFDGLRNVAIGNENCGAKSYAAVWEAFAASIRSRWGSRVQLVANCAGTSSLPSATALAFEPHPDLMDYHDYSSFDDYTTGGQSSAFDLLDRRLLAAFGRVFVSEYSVQVDAGHGNLRAAIGEAAYLVQMEANGDAVVMASYAPLFAHVEDAWGMPGLITHDCQTAFGTPSYHAQALLANTRVDETLAFGVSGNSSLRVSVGRSAGALVLKAVNFGLVDTSLQLSLANETLQLEGSVLTSASPEDENWFDVPKNVSISTFEPVAVREGRGRVTLPALSVVVLKQAG